MPEKRAVWLDNLIYVVCGLAAVAIIGLLVVYKIPFPFDTVWAIVVTIILGGYVLRHFRRQLRYSKFWVSFLLLMAMHVLVLTLLLRHGIPPVWYVLMIGPEILLMSQIIERLLGLRGHGAGPR
jgi:hypothetical protein